TLQAGKIGPPAPERSSSRVSSSVTRALLSERFPCPLGRSIPPLTARRARPRLAREPQGPAGGARPCSAQGRAPAQQAKARPAPSGVSREQVPPAPEIGQQTEGRRPG